jgi:hypothetical protein
MLRTPPQGVPSVNSPPHLPIPQDAPVVNLPQPVQGNNNSPRVQNTPRSGTSGDGSAISSPDQRNSSTPSSPGSSGGSAPSSPGQNPQVVMTPQQRRPPPNSPVSGSSEDGMPTPLDNRRNDPSYKPWPRPNQGRAPMLIRPHTRSQGFVYTPVVPNRRHSSSSSTPNVESSPSTSPRSVESSSDPSLNSRRNPTPATLQLPHGGREVSADPVPPPIPARNPPSRYIPKPPVPCSTTPRKPGGKVLKRFVQMFKSPRNDTSRQSASKETSRQSSDTSQSSPPQAQALETPIPAPRHESSLGHPGAIPKIIPNIEFRPPLFSTVVKNGVPGTTARRFSEPQVIPPTTSSSEMPSECLRPRDPSDERYSLRPRSHPPNYSDQMLIIKE